MIANSLYKEVSNEFSKDTVDHSIVLQIFEAYELLILNSNELDEEESVHLLRNFAFVKSVINDLGNTTNAGNWKCAARIIVPMAVGACTGDGPGAVGGLISGLANAYMDGCMD